MLHGPMTCVEIERVETTRKGSLNQNMLKTLRVVAVSGKLTILVECGDEVLEGVVREEGMDEETSWKRNQAENTKTPCMTLMIDGGSVPLTATTSRR